MTRVLLACLLLAACSNADDPEKRKKTGEEEPAALDPDLRYANCTAVEYIDFDDDGVDEHRRDLEYDHNGMLVYYLHSFLGGDTAYLSEYTYTDDGKLLTRTVDFGDGRIDTHTTTWDGDTPLYLDTDTGPESGVDERTIYEVDEENQIVAFEVDAGLDGEIDGNGKRTWENGLPITWKSDDDNDGSWDRTTRWIWEGDAMTARKRVINGFEEEQRYTLDEAGRILHYDQGPYGFTEPTDVADTTYDCP